MTRSSLQKVALLSLTLVAAMYAAWGCIRPPASAELKAPEHAKAEKPLVVWDGDKNPGSRPKEWANCNLTGRCKSKVTVSSGAGVGGSVGLKWQAGGKDWKGFGWNWFGFYPETAGTDISGYKNLFFKIRLEFQDAKKAPGLKDITVSLTSSTKGEAESTASVSLAAYVESLTDQKWHEIVVPLADLVKGKGEKFDTKLAWELHIGEYSMDERDYALYLDDLGFDNRAVIAMISLPEKRAGAPLGSHVIQVTAKLELGAAGKKVSPYIYGVSFGDPEVMHEMGVTMRRQGGNTASPYDWKTGNSSAGADWFFENRKEHPFSHPDQNWWVTMHRENKKWGMADYFTMPMEWVAKDEKSVGFPKRLYPDSTEWAPDRPDTGNGKSSTVSDTGDDGQRRPHEYRCGEKHPTQNGKQVGLEYNVELVKYCIEQAGFGTAKQGGIGYICLDNEPMLYTSTHRDLFCQGFSYDSYWERTKQYAELIRRVDPSVKIAAPGVWGWTAYMYANADLEYRQKNHLGWDTTAQWPDFGKYGPFLKDFMRRCAEYKRQTGHTLIDILDFHGYSNNSKIDAAGGGTGITPELQEIRVEDIRKFWDESYRDPNTWMGKESFINGKIAYLPLMRGWAKEVGFDGEFAIGEYNHTGSDGGSDISAAVAQAETFAAFAIGELSYGLYWASPGKHTPAYFAWKMFRNPDGKHTAVGDRFILGESSDFGSVGVYVFKDPKRKVASIILINKKAAQGAKVTLELGAAVAEQTVTPYEYSQVSLKAIGELPGIRLGGTTAQVDLPPMSVLRLDVKL